MNPTAYFRDTIAELKQVSWPKPSATLKLTGVVIGISVVVAIYIGALDYSFTNILSQIVK